MRTNTPPKSKLCASGEPPRQMNCGLNVRATIKITPGPGVIARMKLASANMAKVGDMRC